MARSNRILTSGDSVNKPIQSFKKIFEQYNVSEHVKNAIKKSNYKVPTPVQSQVIPLLMEKREVICSAPTGSGKTLAFLMPIIEHLKRPMRLGSFRAVILGPTRELVKQIHREALRLSHGTDLRVHILKDIKEAEKKFNQNSLLKYDILVATPNRLAQLLLKETPVRLDKLEWLIFDECDRLFEMGFKDDLALIYKSANPECHRAMFSATFDSQLETWAQSQMTDLATVIIGGKNRTSSNVEQKLIYVGNEEGKIFSLREIMISGVDVPVLIFVETAEKANRLAEEFMYDDLNIDFITSKREPAERDEIVRRFREGSIWFLVCTDLMGRGIDFKGVNLVINYDCPKTLVSYVHRIGRTGRASAKGKSVTFVSDEDFKYIGPIIRTMQKSGCDLKRSSAQLLKVYEDYSSKLKQQKHKFKCNKPLRQNKSLNEKQKQESSTKYKQNFDKSRKRKQIGGKKIYFNDNDKTKFRSKQTN